MFLPVLNWQDYLIGCLVGSAIYYIVILLVYFRKAFPFTIQASIPLPHSPDVSSGFSQTTAFVRDNGNLKPDSPSSSAGEISTAMQQFIEDLTVLLKDAVTKGFGKSELLLSIRTLLQQYKNLKISGYKDAMLHFIVSSAQSYEDMQLTTAEVAACWT